MKLRITKWKWPLVWRKDYESTVGALKAVNKALTYVLIDLERQKRKTARARSTCLKYEKEARQTKSAALEERNRADHFQKRCEAYEDAARRSGLHFQKMEEREVYCMKKYL